MGGDHKASGVRRRRLDVISRGILNNKNHFRKIIIVFYIRLRNIFIY